MKPGEPFPWAPEDNPLGPTAGQDDEPPTSPDAAAGTAFGRLASIFADLDNYEAKQACDLLVAWVKCGPDNRVLLNALGRELASK